MIVTTYFQLEICIQIMIPLSVGDTLVLPLAHTLAALVQWQPRVAAARSPSCEYDAGDGTQGCS